MPLFSAARRLFRSKERHAALESTQASSLVAAARGEGGTATVPDITPVASSRGDLQEADGMHSNGRLTDGAEEAPVIETGRSLRGRGPSAQDELRSLVQNIGTTLDRHADRSDRIAELLNDVPARLETLPEMSRRQVHMVEAMQDHLEQIARRDEQMQNTIATLSETAQRHGDLLERISTQLEDGNHHTAAVSAAVGSLEETVHTLSATGEKQQEVLAEMAADNREHNESFTRHVRSAERWIITAAICCCGAAVAAALVAVLAVIIQA